MASLYLRVAVSSRTCARCFFIIPREVPSTRVGHESILAVRPFRKIWWRKRTVSEFRKMELMSSWEQGGALEEAAILNGRRKQEMSISSCSTYSSSASTMRKTRLRKTEISFPPRQSGSIVVSPGRPEIKISQPASQRASNKLLRRRDWTDSHSTHQFLFLILSAWGDFM